MEIHAMTKSGEIHETTRPVISPYWRLKHSGKWNVLWKYDPDEIIYLIIRPLASAIIPLCNGIWTMREIAMIFQYAQGFNSLDKSINLVTKIIQSTNSEHDCIVEMNDSIAPFVKKYDPLEYIVSPNAFKEQARLSFPLNLNVIFSNNCQTDCLYCYANRRRISHSRELSAERWKELFHEARELGIEAISLSGGDPLFRKDAVDLIAELIKLDMLFLLSTKCHVPAQIADELVSAGMTSSLNRIKREIQISMDGPDASTADILAGSKGYFSRALDSIKNLVERDFNVRVKAVITPLNADKIYDWARLLSNQGVKKISCAAYNRTYYRHNDSLFLTPEDHIRIREQFDRIKSDFPHLDLRKTGFSEEMGNGKEVTAKPARSSQPITDEKHKLETEKTISWQNRAFCSGGRSSMTITPDGKVVLCDTVPQDDIFVVGDLTEQSIKEVWDSDTVVNFAYPDRENFKNTECYTCEDRLECHVLYGYCFRDSFFNYGSIFTPPPKCPKAPDDGLRME